jgi:hypothetical protein
LSLPSYLSFTTFNVLSRGPAIYTSCSILFFSRSFVPVFVLHSHSAHFQRLRQNLLDLYLREGCLVDQWDVFLPSTVPPHPQSYIQDRVHVLAMKPAPLCPLLQILLVLIAQRVAPWRLVNNNRVRRISLSRPRTPTLLHSHP